MRVGERILEKSVREMTGKSSTSRADSMKEVGERAEVDQEHCDLTHEVAEEPESVELKRLGKDTWWSIRSSW